MLHSYTFSLRAEKFYLQSAKGDILLQFTNFQRNVDQFNSIATQFCFSHWNPISYTERPCFPEQFETSNSLFAWVSLQSIPIRTPYIFFQFTYSHALLLPLPILETWGPFVDLVGKARSRAHVALPRPCEMHVQSTGWRGTEWKQRNRTFEVWPGPHSFP